jgi:hypothetical protein
MGAKICEQSEELRCVSTPFWIWTPQKPFAVMQLGESRLSGEEPRFLVPGTPILGQWMDFYHIEVFG